MRSAVLFARAATKSSLIYSVSRQNKTDTDRLRAGANKTRGVAGQFDGVPAISHKRKQRNCKKATPFLGGPMIGSIA